ncbi:MAG: hypothetical protein F6K26_20710 [Moorea sp. SIO2I5]|nr:hypothetical protein [Moorena sp. SIO2I5]
MLGCAGVGSREWGVGSRESGVGSGESGVGSGKKFCLPHYSENSYNYNL